MKNKEMGYEDLARMIKKGFDHNDERFDRIEKNIGKLSDGQERLEIGLKEVKQDLTFTARKFEMKELESRVEKLEYKMAKMSK